ncbi:MAG: 4Fe-4S binding protein [Spirochaetales bacterium]|nr:4Fe-4S binding protein [Spirochaetales bacterium]
MKKSIKWYQVTRAILPIVYTALLITGLLWKSPLMVIILLGIAFLSGAFYCGWLCPFGFTQEWLGNLGRVLNLPYLRVPTKVERWLRFSRYILFGLSMTGLAFVYFLSDPYNNFMGLIVGNTGYVTIGGWILLGGFILSSMLIDRPFCRYFCTEGARYGGLSMARIFSIRRDKDKCVSCGACDRKCPSQIKVSVKGHVRNGQCINCFKCIDACPVEGTLSYGWVFRKQGDKDEQSI